MYHSILTNNLPNLLEYGNITALTNLWYTGQITNFEYLTHLNKHAGRSFNDLMQYPVFPFILADYISETLDLSDPSIYRWVEASPPFGFTYVIFMSLKIFIIKKIQRGIKIKWLCNKPPYSTIMNYKIFII